MSQVKAHTDCRGTFISLEGVDGSGKSTQAALLAESLEAAGYEVLRLREPGGTAISEKIRALLLDPANTEMADECELLLYEAARAQLVCEVIEPALKCGVVVVCDRFYDSTFAYQAGARGIDEKIVLSANSLGSCGISPDLTLVFDLDPELAFARATHGGADRLEAEGLAFQRRVRAGYMRLAELEPERVCVLDASGDPSEVFGRVTTLLADLMPKLGGGSDV